MNNHFKIIIMGMAFWVLGTFSALAWTNHDYLTYSALEEQVVFEIFKNTHGGFGQWYDVRRETAGDLQDI